LHRRQSKVDRETQKPELTMQSHVLARIHSAPAPHSTQESSKAVIATAKRQDCEGRRVQQSWLAEGEKNLLLWLAARTPCWVNSDHLTALGFAAQLAAGACYALARWNRYAFLAASFCLFLNWFGDSLDGTLARFRQQLRPRYGFYVDHMIDTFGAVALLGGLSCSGCMHAWIAIGLLVAFLMLSIQSYLAAHVLGEFRLSFWRFGPTELRLLLVLGNLVALRKPQVHILHVRFQLFDVGGCIGIAGMTLILVFFTTENAIRLYREERIAH
jgi:archaetidylinositol phosphate synthase